MQPNEALKRVVVLAVAAVSYLAGPRAQAQICPPGFEAGHHVDYYVVVGITHEDLERSLERRAPSGSYGERFYGLTEWCVRWTFVPWKRRDRCELIHTSTILQTRVTLPRWVDSEKAPARLASWWAAFSRVLEEHENVHVENARAAERAIQAAFSELEPAASCGVATRSADRIARDLFWEYRARDQEFDRETRNGLVQLEEALVQQ